MKHTASVNGGDPFEVVSFKKDGALREYSQLETTVASVCERRQDRHAVVASAQYLRRAEAGDGGGGANIDLPRNANAQLPVLQAVDVETPGCGQATQDKYNLQIIGLYIFPGSGQRCSRRLMP